MINKLSKNKNKKIKKKTQKYKTRHRTKNTSHTGFLKYTLPKQYYCTRCSFSFNEKIIMKKGIHTTERNKTKQNRKRKEHTIRLLFIITILFSTTKKSRHQQVTHHNPFSKRIDQSTTSHKYNNCCVFMYLFIYLFVLLFLFIIILLIIFIIIIITIVIFIIIIFFWI